MAALNGIVILSGITFVLFILGLHNFLTSFEENGCEMTYMYEYPQYVKISLSPNITKRYSRYGLYVYGEGQFTDRLRQMKFSGIPVLFIHGNSGSYKQVRSLASVSLRKTISSHLPFHFDYFTVNLNDEYSGLFGGILQDQTDFVHYCIKKILLLYKPGLYSPTSVILIGHSMGGMVAKGLFLNSDFDTDLVKLIITFATPHKAPVIAIDRHLTNYHSRVNAYWVANRLNSGRGNLSHVTLVSIGGGHRDLMVRSGLTQAEEADISILSTAIPTVWLSTDHLCSMWCKELVLVTVRALFDSVDLRTMQMSDSTKERRSVFKYHFLKRTAGKRMAYAFHPLEISFDPNGIWNEYLKRQISVMESGSMHTVSYTMVRLIDDPKHALLAAEAVNVEIKDWVFACSANTIHGSSRVCSTGINLSNKTQLVPSQKSKRKLIYLNLVELKKKGFTHVVLRLPPTKEKVQLHIDIHSVNRRLNVALPSLLSFTMKSTIIDATDDNAIYYELALPNFDQVWQAYLLHITPLTCRLPLHEAVAIMEVPWSKEDSYIRITDSVQKAFRLKLQTPRPSSYTGNKTVKVRLILDPTCKYTVQIQSSILDSLGQLVRFYITMLLPYLAAVLLLTLRWQFLSMAKTGQCVMFHTALGSGAKPFYILPVVKMASRLLGWSFLGKLLLPFITQFDPMVLLENNLDFLLLPFMLYMVAFGIAYALGLGCWLSVIFSGHTAHKVALRFLAKSITGTITWSEWALAAMAKLPAVVAALLLALCYTTCGALSLCVAAAFYFLKLCKMYEDYLEELFKYSIRLLTNRKRSKKKDKDETVMGSGTNNKELKEDLQEEEVNKDEKVETGEGKEAETEIRDEESNVGEQNEEKEKKNCNIDEQSEEKEEKSIVCQPDNKTEGDAAKNEEEETRTESNSEESSTLSELHFSFTSLLLWMTATVVHIPTVLVWAHNFRYSTKLQPDPSFTSSVVLCFCAGILWQRKAPAQNLKHYKLVAHSVYVIAVLILTFSTISLHYLAPLLTVAYVIITLHQVFSGIQLSSVGDTLDSSVLSDKIDVSLMTKKEN